MDANQCVYFDRFEEVLTQEPQKQQHNTMSDSGLDIKLDTLKQDIGQSIRSVMSEFDEIRKAFSISKNYIGINGRRIVNAGKSIDASDVVTKGELDEPKKLLKAFSILDPKEGDRFGTLEIKNHRRISKVSRAVDRYDVVVKAQLDESISKLRDEILQRQALEMKTINDSLQTISAQLKITSRD